MVAVLVVPPLARRRNPFVGLQAGLMKGGCVMQSDFSIVRQDQFIKATRDSGYKGTASALSELIDNSIQAGATEVNIKLVAIEEEAISMGRPTMPRVVEEAVADTGRVI